MTQSTVLGVATFTYLPYCFFNLLSPLASIIVAALNYKIVRRTKEVAVDDETPESSQP
jgi:Na+:H+ antiporter, NhaC family